MTASLLNTPGLGNPSDTAQALIPPAAPGHYDEARSHLTDNAKPAAPLSPAWAQFFEHLGPEGLQALPTHFDALSRQIQDDGATYNVHAKPEQPQRPWSLDLFPLLLDSAQWAHIEAGVLQRMRLLDAILSDAYGPQRLLHQGLLPAALVRGHPGYLRALQGCQPPQGWLHIAAFDLVRGPDGLWRLMTQRVQAPSGLGYALENRLAISSQFPQAFQSLRVQRLAATYTAFMEALQAQCPTDGPAHIALLTPGPYSETYFEQAYLARYLGMTLVQGSDLTVRDERLYLKTIQGLRPIHGLIKRLDDSYLDPLELRADSALGVPGLLQAIRAGHVLMANMPGTGFLESPALLGFLPALAQSMLGQELLLPSIPSWWCGERPALDEAARQLGTLVVKPTVRGSSLHHEFETVFTERLLPEERQHWLARITESPSAHTIQEWSPQSQMPSWLPSETGDSNTGRIGMKSVVLRVFALSDGPRSWRVLPGGMARLADTGMPSAAMRHGGSSADVWVRTSEPIDYTSGLLPQHPIGTPTPVTSRAAENLFWLGRYTERAENSVRLTQLLLHMLGSEDVPDAPLAHWLLDMARHNGLLPNNTPDGAADPPLPEVLRTWEQLLLDELSDPNSLSIGSSLQGMRNATQAVRERLSPEHWQLITTAHDHLQRALPQARTNTASRKYAVLQALKSTSAQLCAITGCQTDRMARDNGWRLLYIGRLLERLTFLTHTLQLALDWQILESTTGFEATLSLFDSTIAFHARHQQRRNLHTLCDLLITDRENPRALSWLTHAVRSHLNKLALQHPHELPALSALLPDPHMWEAATLSSGRPPALHALLQTLMQSTWRLSHAIGARSFTHSDAPSTTVMR